MIISNFMLLLASPVVSAAPVAYTIPHLVPSLQVKADRHWNAASPAVKSWATRQGRAIAKGSGNLYPQALDAASKSKWVVQGDLKGEEDIMALAFLVMMEASKSAQEDLKDIMKQLNEINNSKASFRDAHNKVKDDLSKYVGKPPSTPCNPAACGLSFADIEGIHHLPSTRTRHSILLRPAVTIADIRHQETVLKDEIKFYDELYLTEAMRLKQETDRYGKAIEELSNFMQKLSKTSETIIPNLK